MQLSDAEYLRFIAGKLSGFEADSVAAIASHVEAVEAERDALREIARAIAPGDALAYEGDDGGDVRCPFCYGEEDYTQPKPEHSAYHPFRHDVDCIVTKARALLGSGSNDAK